MAPLIYWFKLVGLTRTEILQQCDVTFYFPLIKLFNMFHQLPSPTSIPFIKFYRQIWWITWQCPVILWAKKRFIMNVCFSYWHSVVELQITYTKLCDKKKKGIFFFKLQGLLRTKWNGWFESHIRDNFFLLSIETRVIIGFDLGGP